MISEQRAMRVRPRERDDSRTVRAAVDEVTEQDESVVARERQLLDQARKLPRAAMDVANRDDATVHGMRALAAFRRGVRDGQAAANAATRWPHV